MIRSKRTLKASPYSLYSHVTESFLGSLLNDRNLDPEVIDYLLLLKENLEILTKFMLEDRFKSLPPRKPKNKLALPTKRSTSRDSVDMMYYKGSLPVKARPAELKHIDIINFYKALETFMMRRVYIYELEDLKLGQFSRTAKLVFNILPKLLLVIRSKANPDSKFALDFIFSIVSIYRQFKLNVKPDTDSITDEYCGSSLEGLLRKEFSEKLIGK